MIEVKIRQAIKTGKLNPNKLGEKFWYNYFIAVDELVWARNFIDGYLIHVYSDSYKTEHLATYTLTYDVFENKDVLEVDFKKI